MAGSGMGELRAPIFNGSNYDFWIIKMCTIFKSHKLWDIVENGYDQPVKKEEGEILTAAQTLALEENVAKDAKALGLIQSAVSDDIFPRIALKELTKEAWETLQQEFRGDKKVRSVKLQALRREFEYIRMQEDDSLSDYITKVLELVNHMKAYDEEIADRRIVHKLLISLSREYDSIAEVIEETKDTETIGVQKVIGSLKSHEQSLQRHSEKLTEKAFSSLSVNSKEHSNAAQYGSSKSKKNWKSQNKKKWEGKSGSKPKCCKCERFGHLANDCSGKAPQAAHYAKHMEKEGTMLYACHVASVLKNSSIWYVDSACSNHMTSHESLLIDIDTNVTVKVKMGTGDLVQVTDDRAWIFLAFGDSIVEIYDDKSLKHLVAKVPMIGNRCFPLSLKYVNVVAMKATVKETTCWHRRYGHLNLPNLRLLQQKELVYRLPEISDLEKVYFMKFKYEVFNIFQKFKAMVELQSGYKIKRLRSDKGGEYTSAEFMKFCEDIGMERQFTIAYSLEQNGVAENKNKTIVEMSKAMMHEKKLPYQFWGEAVNTAGYMVYNLQSNKITVSRSVIFDEDSLWGWENRNVQHISIPMSCEDGARDTEMESGLSDSSTQESQFGSPSSFRSKEENATQSETPVKLRDIAKIYAR
ncbi:uncharacterized protein LOC109947236 [Prunus persica]|uniref:uncharacterized protein LOC109947236 n=1 Tax=Prunus persica TaxID=3760 RepID=UPI0009AB3140|nr:uncharacterized protein LOC109947236 [Prunus persica]